MLFVVVLSIIGVLVIGFIAHKSTPFELKYTPSIKGKVKLFSLFGHTNFKKEDIICLKF